MRRILVKGFLLIILILLLLCVFLVSISSQLYFWSSTNIAWLIGLPIILSVIIVYSLLKGERLQIQISISIITSIICLYVIESSLLILGDNAFLPSNFDKRGKPEVLKDLKEKGIEAHVSIGARLFWNSEYSTASNPLLPLGGISDTTTVFCNEFGTFELYKSDNHGFSNPPKVWNGIFPDIAIIGDSLSHGFCISREKSFAGIIRSTYPNTINLGYNGAGPLSELAAIKEYLTSKKPKLTLWFYFEGNDIEEFTVELRDPVLTKYLDDKTFSQHLMEGQNQIDKTLKEYESNELAKGHDALSTLGYRTTLNYFLDNATLWLKLWHTREILHLVDMKANWPLHLDKDAPPDDVIEQKFKAVILRAQELAHAWKGRFIFVYLPALRTFERSIRHPWKDRIEKVLTETNTETFDITPIFASSSNPLLYYSIRDKVHLSEEGNRLVAQTIISKLETSWAIGGKHSS